MEQTSTMIRDEAREGEKIIVTKTGALVTFSLNRPSTLNAFDDDMRRILADEIPRIARDPDVYIVALESRSPKAFCAGGDVKALAQLARTDIETAKTYFGNEYQLDWLLECFSKPTVSFINGVCMGSGAGLTCFNTHRIAGENYAWAMPETAIGLFPDVGVAHVLARLPWPIGLYLGLTGRKVGRGDARRFGLATHTIGSEHFEAIKAALADAQPVDILLDGLDQAVEPGPIASDLALIQDFFGEGSVDAIMRRLENAQGVAKDWAQKVLGELKRKSPLSLAITDRHIRSARNLDLRETLMQDYRLAVRCLEGNDFMEGVRALLVDKDQKPAWTPERLDLVTEEIVSSYFRPLGGKDLNLASRTEMQAARV